MGETSEIGGRPPLDYDLTIRCAKEGGGIRRNVDENRDKL